MNTQCVADIIKPHGMSKLGKKQADNVAPSCEFTHLLVFHQADPKWDRPPGTLLNYPFLWDGCDVDYEVCKRNYPGRGEQFLLFPRGKESSPTVKADSRGDSKGRGRPPLSKVAQQNRGGSKTLPHSAVLSCTPLFTESDMDTPLFTESDMESGKEGDKPYVEASKPLVGIALRSPFASTRGGAH